MKSLVSYRGKTGVACALAALAALVVGSAAVSAKTTARGVPTSAAGTGKHISATAPPSPNTVPSGYMVVSSGSLAAAAGTETFGSVACPAAAHYNRFPTGGGVFISSIDLAVNINNSFPSGTSWDGYVNNGSNSSTSFQVWAVCAKPKATYSQAESAAVDNPSGSQSFGTALCPHGTKVLGGGASSPNADLSQNINTSAPIVSGGNYGWLVDMNNSGGNDDSFFVWATCEKYSPSKAGYRIVSGSSTDNPSGSQDGAGVSCPAGDSVLGGGIAASSFSDVVNTNSDWPTSSTGWFGYENNASGSDDTIFASAVCAF
jgi:hypothetical protein